MPHSYYIYYRVAQPAQAQTLVRHIQAALKAVSQRKYEATVLDGEPTPVDLRVEVTFHMD